jgi:pimeloyl-ACP methyl ester carboxylesterase
LIQNLSGAEGLDERIVDRADMSRLGIAGHSYGAYTATVIAGARLERDSIAAADPALRRFSAAIAISGQGAGRKSLADKSFESVRMPLFGITGTKDVGAAGETPDWRLQSFRDSPPGDKFAAVVNGFGHTDFDSPAGEPTRGAVGEELRGLQLAFWDGYLKDSSSRRATLAARARTSSANDPIVVHRR